jgi:phosphatidylserine decarboxylase
MQIAKEGYLFITIPFVVGLGLFIIGYGIISVVIGVLCIVISMFCLYFFRDPKVKITNGSDLIISPCNGTVLDVSENEVGKIIRVFLSVFDVHLQRSPVSGRVTNIEYKYGKFLRAMTSQAHIVNEQNIITIENKNGKYLVKQIAGVLARRCVSWVKIGDFLNAGDKIGIIKFGSQVDLQIPKIADVKVKCGDKVTSGITVFAKIGGNYYE